MTRLFNDTDTKALLAKHCPDHPVHSLHLFESISLGWLAHDAANKAELDALLAKGWRTRTKAETERMYSLGYCYHEARPLKFELTDEVRATIARSDLVTLVLSLPSPFSTTMDYVCGGGMVIRQMLGHDVTIHIDRSRHPMRIVCHDPCQAVDFAPYAAVLKRHYADADIIEATGLKQQVRGETHCVLLAAVNAIEFARHKRLPDRKRAGEGLGDRSGLSYALATELDKARLAELAEFQAKHEQHWRALSACLRLKLDPVVPINPCRLMARESQYIYLEGDHYAECYRCITTITSAVGLDEAFAQGAAAAISKVRQAICRLHAVLKTPPYSELRLCRVLVEDMEAVARDIELELVPRSVIDMSAVCQ